MNTTLILAKHHQQLQAVIGFPANVVRKFKIQEKTSIQLNQIPETHLKCLPAMIDPDDELSECRSITIDGIELMIGHFYAKKKSTETATFFEIEAIYIVGREYFIIGKDVFCKYHPYFCTYVIDKTASNTSLNKLYIKSLISGRTFEKVFFNDCEQILCYIKLTEKFKILTLQ